MSNSESSGATLSGGHVTRSVPEIARVLDLLVARGTTIEARLHGGELLFQSKLLAIEPSRQHIVVQVSSNLAANEALLARPRCSFHVDIPPLHLEFVAADPRKTLYKLKPAIQLAFPEVLVSHQRREHLRATVISQPPLRCVADAGGITPFDGEIVDISAGGIGILVYSPDITLEPGTVLRGCRITHADREPVMVDLEVWYSMPAELPGGKRVMRSGCRFLDPSDEVRNLVGLFVGEKPPE